MDILVIGGTQFVGRAIVEAAVDRGDDVTVFHRGESEPGDLPAVRHLHGDRDGDLSALSGRTWDEVIDVCAYVPGQLRSLATALDTPGHFTLISTLSVNDESLPPGANEESPLLAPAAPEVTQVTEESYGPLKAACEMVARELFPGCLIIRPGYVVGPHDTTDRFTYWVRRAAAGGTMLAPGSHDEPMQFIDARDLAAFTLGRAAAHDDEVYGVVRPVGESTTGSVLQAALDASGADTDIVWVSGDRLIETLGEELWTLLPMWHPQLSGTHRYDPSKALAAGLTPRPLVRTVDDIFTWDRARGGAVLRAGLTPERERALLEQLAETRA